MKGRFAILTLCLSMALGSARAAVPSGEKLSEAERLSNRAALLAQDGKLDEAVALLQQAVQSDPRFSPAWYNLGLAYQRMEQWRKAAGIFETVVELLPDHGEAWFRLGTARSRLGQHQDAAAAMLRAHELRPDDPRPLVQLGYEAWHIGRWQAAIESWETYLRDFPDHEARTQVKEQLPGAYYNPARSHQNAGRVDRAVAAYQQVLEMRPESPKAVYNLGLLLRDSGAYGLADTVLQTALAVDGRNPDVYALLGSVAVYRDSFEVATDYFMRALALEPGHEQALRGLVQLRLDQGRFEDAEKVARDLLQANPTNAGRHALLAYVYEHNREGERYGAGFDAERAQRAYRNASTFNPEKPAYYYNRGIILGRMERWKEAEEEFLKVLAIDSTHAGVRKWLPVIRANLKEEEAAVR